MLARRWRRSVVFPAPRKPVTSSRGSFCCGMPYPNMRFSKLRHMFSMFVELKFPPGRGIRVWKAWRDRSSRRRSRVWYPCTTNSTFHYILNNGAPLSFRELRTVCLSKAFSVVTARIFPPPTLKTHFSIITGSIPGPRCTLLLVYWALFSLKHATGNSCVGCCGLCRSIQPLCHFQRPSIRVLSSSEKLIRYLAERLHPRK